MALYAFDGTGDCWEILPEDQGLPIFEQRTKKQRFLTNVVLFTSFYQKYNSQVYYYSGVGTSGLIYQILSKFFGLGARAKVRRAFRDLQTSFKRGDLTIDVIGYSRGAAIARMFIDQISRDFHKLTYRKAPFDRAPKIRFVGLFDTVASFGWSFNDYEYHFQKKIPSNVQHAFHAMSIDSRSPGFRLDRAYGQNVSEVWFRGGHSDIGGNSKIKEKPNRKRSNIALEFMLKKARACGIDLNWPELETDPDAPIHAKKSLKATVDLSRIIHDFDLIHHSVYASKDYQEAGLFDGINQAIPSKELAIIERAEEELNLFKYTILKLSPKLASYYKNTEDIYQLLYDHLQN